ncbi:MAG: mannose-6-phosphate isomerase, partial [Enterocloster aldenensis]
MRELLMMEPIFKEAIWGGSRLKEVYGYDIPSGHTGE